MLFSGLCCVQYLGCSYSAFSASQRTHDWPIHAGRASAIYDINDLMLVLAVCVLNLFPKFVSSLRVMDNPKYACYDEH